MIMRRRLRGKLFSSKSHLLVMLHCMKEDSLVKILMGLESYMAVSQDLKNIIMWTEIDMGLPGSLITMGIVSAMSGIVISKVTH